MIYIIINKLLIEICAFSHKDSTELSFLFVIEYCFF